MYMFVCESMHSRVCRGVGGVVCACIGVFVCMWEWAAVTSETPSSRCLGHRVPARRGCCSTHICWIEVNRKSPLIIELGVWSSWPQRQELQSERTLKLMLTEVRFGVDNRGQVIHVLCLPVFSTASKMNLSYLEIRSSTIVTFSGCQQLRPGLSPGEVSRVGRGGRPSSPPGQTQWLGQRPLRCRVCRAP